MLAVVAPSSRLELLDSVVELLKYGKCPEVVVPETVRGKERLTLPQPEQEETVIPPGKLTALVLGLMVKLAIVFGSCDPDVLGTARIE